MKAVAYNQYGGPEVLEIVEMEKPVPKENEVLIKVGASGVNPVDTYFRSGIRQVPSFPHIPHFDLGGTVVAVGESVTKWQIGEKVWGTNIQGTAAEYVSVHEDKLFPLASHLTEVDGAALAMAFTTAYLALFTRGKLEAGETVLIYGGSGAVGHAAIQLAKEKGAIIIATASSADKAALAKQAGADHVIVYTQENVVKKGLELTNETGIDLIIDVSLSDNIIQDFEVLKNGGRIVAVGSPKNNTPILPWRMLNMKNAALLGVLLFTAPPHELLEAGNVISSLFANKKLTTHIGKVFTFEQASAAHHALAEKTYSGNILITPK